MSNAYLYRLWPASAAQLRSIATRMLTLPCWTFGGASLWDMNLALKDKRANLREISPLTSLAALETLDVDGDFGHAFCATAELRWRRRAAEAYDLLILSEQPREVAGAQPLLVRWRDEKTGEERIEGWRAGEPDRKGILQSNDRPPIGYIPYYAPNGAIQFLRYTQLKEA